MCVVLFSLSLSIFYCDPHANRKAQICAYPVHIQIRTRPVLSEVQQILYNLLRGLGVLYFKPAMGKNLSKEGQRPGAAAPGGAPAAAGARSIEG